MRTGPQQDEPTPENIQRKRQIIGLLLIALIVLIASVWRAGLASIFPPGWWRLW